VVALTHKTGCGMASEGEGMELLRRTLTGYAQHPNFFAVLSIGLGCEANQINTWMGSAKLRVSDKLQAFTIQEKGGTTKAVKDGIARVAARTAIRASAPIRRSARQRISWCATAARRSYPRPRRSTAPSTCSRAAP
jgi:altronate dehydratase